MSEYLSELHTCHITDKIYRLDTPLIYKSDLVGIVEVPAGFYTDLASVPRVPILWWFYGDRAHKSAVIHDYLFCIDAKPEVSWMMANRVFLEAMETGGHWFYVRYPMFAGVVIGSRLCWHKRKVLDKL